MTAAALAALARACTLVIHGCTVAGILDSAQWDAQPRDLRVLELWAGVGNVAGAARMGGLEAATFEIQDGVEQDFFSVGGFLSAVGQIMRLSVGGLLAMAPTCSSFGFANVSRTKRSKTNWAGDPTYPQAVNGNWEAELACFFLCLALARGVQAFIENPAGSYLFSFLAPHLEPLVCLQTATTPRCAFSSEPLGQRFQKPFKFLAAGPWIARVSRPCPCGDHGHLPLMERNEQGQVTGVRERMLLSQVYPLALGQALIAGWLAEGQGAPVLPPVRLEGGLAEQANSQTEVDDPWATALRKPAASSPAATRRTRAPGAPGAPRAPAAPAEDGGEDDPWATALQLHQPDQEDPWAAVQGRPAAQLTDDDPWAAAGG